MQEELIARSKLEMLENEKQCFAVFRRLGDEFESFKKIMICPHQWIYLNYMYKFIAAFISH